MREDVSGEQENLRTRRSKEERTEKLRNTERVLGVLIMDMNKLPCRVREKLLSGTPLGFRVHTAE